MKLPWLPSVHSYMRWLGTQERNGADLRFVPAHHHETTAFRKPADVGKTPEASNGE